MFFKKKKKKEKIRHLEQCLANSKCFVSAGDYSVIVMITFNDLFSVTRCQTGRGDRIFL